MSGFCVGDRVEFVYRPDQHISANIEAGDTGTIAVIDFDNSIGVAWDKDVGGHNLAGQCEEGHGWFVDARDLMPHSESSFEPSSDAELMQFLFSK